MKNFKIRIKNERHSKAVQNRLFEMGYEWNDGSLKVSCTDKKYLTLWDDKSFTHGSEDHKGVREKTLDDLYEMEENKLTLPTILGYEGKDLGDYIGYGCKMFNKTWLLSEEFKSVSSLSFSEGIVTIKLKEVIKYLKQNEEIF